jgi:hypothetical protein
MLLLKPATRGEISRMLATDAPANRRVNLPGLIGHQIEREASANAALAPMAQFPTILALRVIRAAWEGLTR